MEKVRKVLSGTGAQPWTRCSTAWSPWRSRRWSPRTSRCGWARADRTEGCRSRLGGMTEVDWNFQLAEQLDWHWREQLRPRLDGMTDTEYRWQPVTGAWNVRPRGTGSAPLQVGTGEFAIDLAVPAPVPAPVTTIAWRLGHIIVGVLGMRVAAHFGGPPFGYATHRYPGDAATALAQLDDVYAGWIAGVRVIELGQDRKSTRLNS